MLYSQDRSKQRQFLAKSWQKFINKEPLEQLEKQLVEIINIHQEYQDLIKNTDLEYFSEQGEVNPFLHINLHLALREQLSINQPLGIKKAYDKLLSTVKDEHTVEHMMMDCIAEMIFLSQKNSKPMDSESYLQCIQKQLENS